MYKVLLNKIDSYRKYKVVQGRGCQGNMGNGLNHSKITSSRMRLGCGLYYLLTLLQIPSFAILQFAGVTFICEDTIIQNYNPKTFEVVDASKQK